MERPEMLVAGILESAAKFFREGRIDEALEELDEANYFVEDLENDRAGMGKSP